MRTHPFIPLLILLLSASAPTSLQAKARETPGARERGNLSKEDRKQLQAARHQLEEADQSLTEKEREAARNALDSARETLEKNHSLAERQSVLDAKHGVDQALHALQEKHWGDARKHVEEARSYLTETMAPDTPKEGPRSDTAHQPYWSELHGNTDPDKNWMQEAGETESSH